MIDYADAINTTLDAVRPLPAESVPLAESDRRVLTRDVRTRVDLPRFDQSAMDGYAVLLPDTSHASRRPVEWA